MSENLEVKKILGNAFLEIADAIQTGKFGFNFSYFKTYHFKIVCLDTTVEQTVAGFNKPPQNATHIKRCMERFYEILK